MSQLIDNRCCERLLLVLFRHAGCGSRIHTESCFHGYLLFVWMRGSEIKPSQFGSKIGIIFQCIGNFLQVFHLLLQQYHPHLVAIVLIVEREIVVQFWSQCYRGKQDC